MRNLTVLVIIAAFCLSELPPTPSFAQTQTSAQEKAANLHAQLAEVETRQAGLQTRLQELDEAMKPENIAERLAGVGSTHPEDLREQRRRQLEIERNGVQRQLDLLTASHARLETAIASADAEAYRQSAAPGNGPSVNTPVDDSVATPTRPRRTRKKKSKKSKRLRQQQTVTP